MWLKHASKQLVFDRVITVKLPIEAFPHKRRIPDTTWVQGNWY